MLPIITIKMTKMIMLSKVVISEQLFSTVQSIIDWNRLHIKYQLMINDNS